MALDPLLSLSDGEHRFPLSFTPDFQIVQVNSNGLVVRCSRSFEWGATLQLGVMMQIQIPSAKAMEDSDEPGEENRGDSFLDVKGIVVDCHEVISYPAAQPQFEITLFYDSVTEEQCASLLRASSQRSDLESSSSTAFNVGRFDDPDGFDRVCGLN